MMQSICELIQSDQLIQMINQQCEIDTVTNKWMFENEEQLQASPQIVQITNVNTNKSSEISHSILKNNQELFNVNYSKSVYANKINSLIDMNSLKKQQKQILKTKKRIEINFDKSNQDYLEDSNQIKLAKNRQSARDSRRRKKIYVELLETKVEELSKQVLILQKSLDEQNNFINHCVKIPTLISEFNINYQNAFQKLCEKKIFIDNIKTFDEEFGINSQQREYLCHIIFNTLVDHILPYDLKKTVDSALNEQSYFTQEEILKQNHIEFFKQSFQSQFKKLELTLFDLAKQFEYVNKEALLLQKIKYSLIEYIGPEKYILNLLENKQDIVVKEEDRIIKILEEN